MIYLYGLKTHSKKECKRECRKECFSSTLALYSFQAASTERAIVTSLICILLEHSQAWNHIYGHPFCASLCLVSPTHHLFQRVLFKAGRLAVFCVLI